MSMRQRKAPRAGMTGEKGQRKGRGRLGWVWRRMRTDMQTIEEGEQGADADQLDKDGQWDEGGEEGDDGAGEDGGLPRCAVLGVDGTKEAHGE